MENKRIHSQITTHLVKTDYDNFRDMRFFLRQQKKAESMLREVEEFKQSFVISKMINMRDWVFEHPTEAISIFSVPMLNVFYSEHLKVDGITAYINADAMYLNEFNPKHFAKTYLKELSDKKKNIIWTFYENLKNIRFDVYKRQIVKCGPGEDVVSVDENDSTLIVRDWKKYIVPEEVIKIEHDYFMGVMTGKCDDGRKYDWGFQYDIANRSNNVVLREKVYDTLRERFEIPLRIIDEVFCIHPEIPFRYLSYASGGEHFNCNGGSNCVLWNGRPHWVSNNLDKVRITTNDDETKIICTFEDTADHEEMYSRNTWIKETRTCELTYSADNNELIDYSVKHNSNKYIRE